MGTFVAAVNGFLGDMLMPMGVCGYHISWNDMVNRVNRDIQKGSMTITILGDNDKAWEATLTSLSLALTLDGAELHMGACGLTISPIEIHNIQSPLLFSDGRFVFMTENASYHVVSTSW